VAGRHPVALLRELPTEQLAESSDAGLYATYSAGHHGGLREQASGFDYESLGVPSSRRTRWRDETFDDGRPPEGDKVDSQRRPAGLPPEVRLRPHPGGRRQQARQSIREGGPKKVLDSFIEAAWIAEGVVLWSRRSRRLLWKRRGTSNEDGLS